MCGIAGFLAFKPFGEAGSARAAIKAMTQELRHRGPDAGGEWTDAEPGIALGHRRLSILDLSEAGSQPMVSTSGRYVITYNGEIYNHLDLRADLQVQGRAPSWRGTSDTETILACIEAWGFERTIAEIVGMFAFGVWDRRERCLLLARDRMGEKPLYYGRAGSSFIFGSELRALKAHPEFDATIDRGSVALLLRYNYVPEPYSIYSGVSKLPAGSWLRVDTDPNANSEPVAYWSLQCVAEQGGASPFAGTESAARDDLEALLREVVRSQMISDVPLGAFLSGGVDSSLIVAMMQQVSSTPVHTYSIGFDETQFSETEHARAVANHLGTRHTELTVTQSDALNIVGNLGTLFDEPFADSSQLPTVLLSRMTRQHVSVAMSGDGGDELFGGYNRYVWVPRLWRKTGWMPKALRDRLGVLLERCPASAGVRLEPLFRLFAERYGAPITLGGKLSRLGSILRDANDADDLFARLVREWPNSEALVNDSTNHATLLSDKNMWPRLPSVEERMMAVDSLTYLPDDILVKVDRSAMASSLETRAPFLDPRVVEFAWQLPLSMKIDGTEGKRLLKQVLYKHVPKEMIERPKQGFAIPLDQWLRGELRDWAETLLSEKRLQNDGIFDPRPIRETWREHLAEKRNHGARLWSVLMFQTWHESQ